MIASYLGFRKLKHNATKKYNIKRELHLRTKIIKKLLFIKEYIDKIENSG